MKIGVYTNAYREFSLEDALKKIKDVGNIEMIELGCGEESGFAHCNPEVLLKDENAYNEFVDTINKYNLKISALSCHGNPVSPNEETRKISVDSMKNAVLLAEKLGVSTINCFSGCPGDSENATLANWVTTSWPLDFAQVYEWQWEKKLIPFWKEFTAFAREHGLKQIALELHPGQCCYNPKTIKRLREECGDEIGVNLDFSHLLWQGMDPILVIRELEGMIYHVHGKDIIFDEWKIRQDGRITTAYFDMPRQRAWNFKSIGFHHGAEFWCNIFSELRRVGYDYAVSLEMECETLSIPDAIVKSTEFLTYCLPKDIVTGEQSWQAKTRENRIKRFKDYGFQD